MMKRSKLKSVKGNKEGGKRSSVSTQTDFVVRTKLNRPPLPSDLIPRARLMELLQRNPQRDFTLVSAPAGYGKSTLVSRWVEALDVPGVWLSLDEEENDLRSFLKYVVAAVRMHSPKACRRTAELLDAGTPPPLAVLADYLTNDLQAIKRSFLLVLDDYHRIHQAKVHELLDLIVQRPIGSCHVILVTRRDPPLSLASLRAQGRMIEIREQDLRFTRDETREVIRVMGGLAISDDTLKQLYAGLEGWIVGLRLVCLSLRHQADPEAYLAQLSTGTPSVQEYLLEEVLKQLPADFQTCLLRTSILNRFCAPLCTAVCCYEDEDASASGSDRFTGEDFLHDLQAANLFAIALDSEGQWLRYHHLFQQLLRRQLTQRATCAEIQSLHDRASRWFAAQNLTDEAIEHALAADDVEQAADIVEARRVEILNADQWPILARWLSQLPETVVGRRPELLLGEAWLAYYRFRIPALVWIVEQLDELLDNEDAHPVWQGELSLFKSYLCYWQGQAQVMLQHVAQAQDLLPASHDLARADAEIYFGLGHHIAGQKEAAIKALTQRVRSQPHREGLLSTRRVITLAFIHILAGDLKEGLLYSQQLGELAQTASPVYIKSWSTYLQGCCLFQSGHWQGAAACFRWMAENRYVSHMAAVMSSLTGLALSLQFLGHTDESRAMAQDLLDFAVETKDPANLALAQSGHARIALLQGDTGGSVPVGEAASMATAFLFMEVPHVTHCRWLIKQGSVAKLQQALSLIESLQGICEPIHNTFHLMDMLTLKAVVYRLLEQQDKACQTLEQALTLAAPGAWVRPFVELGSPMIDLLKQVKQQGCAAAPIDRLLAAFPAMQATSNSSQQASRIEQPSMDALTHREQDVLELLVLRLYDKEIAEKLHISLATVKTHLRHLYEKLAVASRRQAVSKARQLGLLKK